MIRFSSSVFSASLIVIGLACALPALAQQTPANSSDDADVIAAKKAKAKAHAKTPAKPATKSTAKAGAKTAPKTAAKPAAKVAAKPAATKVATTPAVTKAVAGKAATKPAAKPVESTEAKGDKPLLVGTYGDWGAYQSTTGKVKVCYALSQPKDRQPTTLQRNPAFMFISRRPANGVKNEISLDMGFPVKENATNAVAEIGPTHYDLVLKGTYAWLKNPAEEVAMMETLRKGAKLVVKAPSIKGNVTTDSYSLTGLAQAWEKVQKDCPLSQ